MAIRPGTLNNFNGSMAQAIETELAPLLDTALPALGTPERRDMRRLFVAIARGVVSHLKANQASMVVPYVDDGMNKSTSVDLMVDGT